jgi:O-antigen/teichoic acid export membrane protein
VSGGLAPTWFSIGIGSVRAIAVYETVPRLIATAIGAGVILTTGALWVYPALLIIVVIAGTSAYGRRVARVSVRDVLRINPARAAWATRASSGTVMTSASYALAPMPLATALSSTVEAASFGSADRLFRLALTGIQVCMNAFQNWIVDETNGMVDRRRARTATLVTLVVGVIGLAVFATAGPWITALLFGAPLATDPVVSASYGVAFLAIAGSSALGRLILIPLGDHRTVFVSTVVGAVVGLSAMLLLGSASGAPGVAIGFAASEAAVAAYQVVVLLRRRRA